MAIIDVVSYNGEKELFEIRYNILKDFVDEFIVVEFDKTFSGKDKPFYFEEEFNKYQVIGGKPFMHYCKAKDNVWHKYMDLAISSPNTKGANHWKEEFCQKEYLKDCLTHLKEDDICFIGDVDEIYNPHLIFFPDKIQKLKLRVYTYYLNNRSNEEFWGTIVGKYGSIKGECLNHLRTRAEKTENYCGWHFTSLKD